jgi:fermentation-respiration switch protein FrsA (DUF1100 family)
MRTDIEFQTADGTTLRGWHLPPPDSGPAPVIVISHGFGAVKELYLDVVGDGLNAAGFGCLVYDHRCVGASDGEPRGELDPFLQVADHRDAITFAQQLPGADPDRVGIWGTSYSGGHVLVVGATDRRVGCVVSQVPTISGHRNTLRRFPGDLLYGARARWAEDRRARLAGASPATVPLRPDLDPAWLAHDPGDAPPVPMGNDPQRWVTATPPARLAAWRNEITLRSQELYAAYEPGVHISRVSPTPLMMIVMSEDSITPTDEILAAYEQALEPKRLVLLPGGHYDAYGIHLQTGLGYARDWFLKHLGA